jgi:hypothetical protein
MPARCPHPRLRSVSVILRNADERPEGVALSVACQDCGQPFEFVGIQSSATVLVSEDRREIRVVIAETKEGAQVEA